MEQIGIDLDPPATVPPQAAAPLDLPAVRRLAWIALLVLAVLQAWAGRFTLTPDGMSYLDLSDAVVAGHWGGLVNAYWSPLYPAMIGLLRVVLRSNAYWEFAVVHLLNLLLFIASIAAFEYFLNPLARLALSWGRHDLEGPRGRAAAYAFFGIFALTMTPLTTPTPDLAVSAAAFVALGALLRLKYSMANRYTPIVLGIALGLGALAKSFLIPWSMVCLVTLAVATWRLSAALRAVTTASLMWAVIVVPWCILLSAHVGRPTFGETGRLAYAWAMDFQESPSNQAMPVAASTPAADSLLPGVGITPHAQGTNPVWYDPARWYGRQQIQWGITRTLRLFGMYLTEYVTAFAPLVVFLWLALLVADPEARRFAWQRGWIVAVPVLTALTAYALVLVATRYIAPFVIAGTLVMWLVLPWPSRLRPMWVLVALVLSCIAVIVAPNGVPVIASQASIFAAVLTAWVFRGGSRGRMVVIALLAAIVTRAFTEAGLPAGTLFALLWALAIAAVASGTIKRDQSLEFSRFIRTALAVTSAIVLGLAAGAKYFDSLFAVSAAAEYHVENLPYAIASDLRDHGITPGMRVAVIGSSFDAYWARAGRLQVVAGVPPALFANFWTMPPAQRDALFAEFAKAGVQAVVATSSPPNPNRADSTWTPTKFHAWIRMLQPAAGH